MSAVRQTIRAWQVTTPFVGRADKGHLNNLIAKMANLRAEEFPGSTTSGASPDVLGARAGDPVADAAQGLSDPRTKVTLTGTDGIRTLLVGGDAAGGKWYGRDAASNETFISSAALLPDLKGPFASWRDKSLLDFRNR